MVAWLYLPRTGLLYGNATDVNTNFREINNMLKIGKSTGRAGSPVRHQCCWRRGTGPYPSRGSGSQDHGCNATINRSDTISSKLS